MVAVGDLRPQFGLPVPLAGLGDGVQEIITCTAWLAFVAGLGVYDDCGVFLVGNDVGAAGQRAVLPRSSNRFCASTYTSNPPTSQFPMRSLTRAVWSSSHWA